MKINKANIPMVRPFKMKHLDYRGRLYICGNIFYTHFSVDGASRNAKATHTHALQLEWSSVEISQAGLPLSRKPTTAVKFDKDNTPSNTDKWRGEASLL